MTYILHKDFSKKEDMTSRRRRLLFFWKPALALISFLAVTIAVVHYESTTGSRDQVHRHYMVKTHY